jgi:hypothetical protein
VCCVSQGWRARLAARQRVPTATAPAARLARARRITHRTENPSRGNVSAEYTVPSRRSCVVRFRVWNTSSLVILTAYYNKMQPYMYFVPDSSLLSLNTAVFCILYWAGQILMRPQARQPHQVADTSTSRADSQARGGPTPEYVRYGSEDSTGLIGSEEEACEACRHRPVTVRHRLAVDSARWR